MGFFSRKKKSLAPGSLKMTPSPTPSSCTIMPSPPVSPALSMHFHAPPVWKPQVTLRVALDPAPLDADNTTFCVMLDQDANVAALRRAIAEHVGSASMSLFKVNIPLLAHKQAIEYRQRFTAPVNLLTAFPAFDLDDPQQVAPSFAAAWNSSPKEDATELKLIDWFSENSQADVISVLVRMSESSTASSELKHPASLVSTEADLQGSNPRTFVTHFAPSEQPVASPRLSLASRASHRAPTVVSITPEQSVRELKAAILRADGRRVIEEHLDRVILWRVEMSEEEMIVIGERGGLKNGRMPWPYPPGAPVPVSLSEDSRPISDYFPENTSNARMVSLSIWLDPRASADMPRPTPSQLNIPSFKYPMTFPEPAACVAVRRPRQRPSTAPAVVLTTSEDVIASSHAFGPRPLSSINSGNTPTSSRPGTGSTIRPSRVSSPLGASSPIQRGLGINLPDPTGPTGPVRSVTAPAGVAPWELVTFATTSPRGSLSASDCSSVDDNNLPSLSFSQLSLTIDPSDSAGPLTPECTERDNLDWLVPRSGDAPRKGSYPRGSISGQGRRFVL